jgi:acylphosphatase
MRKRVVVHGRVQGVFFRDTLRRVASEHDVSGWAANKWDGTVEAVFEGRQEDVEHLVSLAREGPPGASVEHVDVFEEEPESLSGFAIR